MFERYSRTGLALMAAPLYTGPFLAGWSNAPVLIVPALASLFFLMQLSLGRAKADGFPAQLIALAFLALVQLVVVAVVFAVGLAVALTIDTLHLPLWLPLGLTFIGATIGVIRYRSTPDDDALPDVLDDALMSIENDLPLGTDSELQNDWGQEALTALLALPDTAAIGSIDEIVQRLEHLSGTDAYPSLLAKIEEGNRNVDIALLRYLASPKMRTDLQPLYDLGFALELILNSNDMTVLSELTMLIETLLSEDAPAKSLPEPEILSDKAKHVPSLRPLIARVQKRHNTDPTNLPSPIPSSAKEH